MSPAELQWQQKLVNFQQETQATMELLDKCWDKCIHKIGTKLEDGDVACLRNCVERHSDATRYLLERLTKKVEKK